MEQRKGEFMDLLKINKSGRKVTAVNGCSVLQRTVEDDFGFSEEIIRLDENNQMGFEYAWNYWIRIDVIQAENEESFIKMMDTLKILARSRGYSSIQFADSLPNEVLEWLKAYGFIEEVTNADSYCKYLSLRFEEGKKDDI